MKKNNNNKIKNVNKNTTKNKTKLNKSFLIILIIIILVVLIFGILYGKEIAFIMFLGLMIILGFARLLDITKHKKKQRKILQTLLIVFLTFAIIGFLGVAAFLGYVVYSAPEFDTDKLQYKESTILYDSDGNEFAKLGKQKRENIEYNEVSEVFIDALIATEDSRFFQHNGIDIARFSKAAVKQLLGQDDAGGGSTISMQVIKNNFTDTTSTGIKGIIRKFTDIYLAVFKLEKNYTKEQIIEFYINNHNLGSAWGVEEASQTYFGKSASELNLAEASLLAGMYQAPNTYNPYKNPDKAEKRRNTVLNLMVRHGYITKEEADLAKSIPVSSLVSYEASNQSAYQGYIDTLLDEIEEKYGLDPNKTSMLIYTNMNRKKQDAFNDVITGKTYNWIDDYVQAGVVALNSATGKVEAIIASRSTDQKVYNFATDINRQIGSTAKPLFDYGPGIEYNNWSTYTLFNDSYYTYTGGKEITNYDGTHKGIITLRYALSDSRNVPALKAFQQVDKKKIIEFVTSVGITPEISGNTLHEAHAIGAFNGANPMQMAGAYQVFSNGGKYTEPYLVSKIVIRSTGEVIENSNETKQVISDATAYMITDVLKDVAAKERLMRSYKYNITDNFAAKTGTTNLPANAWQNYPGLPSDAISDCWVMGYTNKTVISLWYGYKSLDKEHPERTLHWVPATTERAKLFNILANAAFDHDGTDFEMPSSVVKVGIERGTNPPLLASSNTPADQIVYELFKKGTEPTEYSTAYSRLDNPTNFSINYKNNKVYLTWNKVNDPGYLADGVLGYYIYFNDEQIAFTTKTSYTIDDLDDYIGTYTIKTGYNDTSTSMSSGVTRQLQSTVSYELALKNKNTTYLRVGENIPKELYDGSLVILKENGKDINKDLTNYLTIKFQNSSMDTIDTISNDTPETYTITYTIDYKGYTNSISNKIVIRE